MDVHVVTPDREVWSGPAQMVIARGLEGEVGVLSGHAPLLIQLAIAPLRIQQEDGEWLRAVVDGGFMHVTTEGGETRVDVLATHAELALEVDLEAARRGKAEAEHRLQARETDEAEVDAIRVELQKAEARISAAG